MLDLIFSSCVNLNTDSPSDIFIPPDSHHPPIQFSLPILWNTTPNRSVSTIRNFRNANCTAINDYLCSINWDNDLSELSVEAAVDVLYLHLSNCVDLYVPTKSIYRSSDPSWFSKQSIFFMCSPSLSILLDCLVSSSTLPI